MWGPFEKLLGKHSETPPHGLKEQARTSMEAEAASCEGSSPCNQDAVKGPPSQRWVWSLPLAPGSPAWGLGTDQVVYQ